MYLYSNFKNGHFHKTALQKSEYKFYIYIKLYHNAQLRSEPLHIWVTLDSQCDYKSLLSNNCIL